MSYSFRPILHHYANRQGLHKIVFQFYYKKIKLYPDTEVKVKASQWNGSVINHPQREKMNSLIATKKNQYEGRLLEALKTKSEFTKEELAEILTGRKIKPVLRFDSFAYSYIDEMNNKLSNGRIKHYRSIINKVLLFEDNTSLLDINGTWLQRFENWLHDKKLQSGTINSNIKIIKCLVRAAEAKGIINQANFRGYKNPKVITAEAEFLTEFELQAFFSVARAINHPAHKLAAYYFLLSCLTGYRLGTAKKFNYSSHVIGNEIIIRTNKNNKVVTIPLFSDLSEVLDYIHDKPFYLSEQKARIYIKEISKLAGIKKHVKYHCSRHTATSLFLSKGLSLSEVSEIIGDTESVTKIYAHIDKQKLNEKIIKLMG